MAAGTGTDNALGDAEVVAGALARADEAFDAWPGAEADVVLGDARVRVRVAGPRLAEQLLPHLSRATVAPAGTPDVVLTAFDTTESGLVPPIPTSEPGRRGGDYHLAYEPDSPLLSVLEGGRGAWWTADGAGLPQWHALAPLRDPMRWALRRHGFQLLHPAAVGGEDACVLVAGVAGSGKSTTAMACCARGLRHLADDYVFVDADAVAHPTYTAAKLDARSIGLLGVTGDKRAGDEKWSVDPLAAGEVAAPLPISAIVLPRVGETTGTPELVRPMEALTALAPNTLIQLVGSGPVDLAALSALVRRLPTYRLVVGPDLDAVADRIRALL